MTGEQRDQLRQLAERATPGPWWSDGCWVWPDHSDHEIDVCTAEKEANAVFIAAAHPQAILALLTAHDALAAENRALREALELARPHVEFARGTHSDYQGQEAEEQAARAALARIDAALQPPALPAEAGDCRHGSGGPPSECGLCDDEGWTPGCDETEYLRESSEGRRLREAIEAPKGGPR